jgi:chemotaxis protein MotB
MAGDEKQPIRVKRIKKVAGAHHGGAWKIAYADFVTAMMAFFLLMWLLGSTAKGDLAGIADYFKTPLKVALGGGSGSGDSSSVIKGGGQDLTRSNGQVKRGDRTSEKRVIDIRASETERARVEKEHLKSLLQKVRELVESSPRLQPFSKQLLLDITTEGLRIQIIDEQNRPMFDSGSARLRDYTREILRELVPLLSGVEYKISLSGHTDAAPYALGEKGYSNWELSADRANASRRELIAGGLDEKKVLRVTGLASAAPLDAGDPLNPTNRRISIVVLNKETEGKVVHEGVTAEVPSASEISPEAIKNGTPNDAVATGEGNGLQR